MKGGNAAEGKLKTMWDGPRPDARTGPKGQQCSYQPMRKQGAIILGTGGDNSNRAEGRQKTRFVSNIAKVGTTLTKTNNAFRQATSTKAGW